MAAPSVFSSISSRFQPLSYWWEAWAPRRDFPPSCRVDRMSAIIGAAYAGSTRRSSWSAPVISSTVFEAGDFI